ncbi:Aste57867_1655 [Aphanomyces stellatus]|uniref:Aste57867_1655 protein n=1 Tax=Aphanomyces stellatus TaxID=120398 RepID=A0A485KAW3_9STRA|nr:hypothetical protein As57867_001653 [Aphanomyces stellatus]VFT78867.1 Aste57867_1655 [Aphanomyces stellatus]
MTVLPHVVAPVLVVCSILVVVFRERLVIKRAQWPLLITMLVGGICSCAYVDPGGWRPVVRALRGPTHHHRVGLHAHLFIFGSLLVKGLRVYRVFSNKWLKKVKVTVPPRHARRRRRYVVFNVTAWMVVDFPTPTAATTAATDFIGKVDHVSCHSSSFIFAALLVFWKAIIMLGGVYVSVLIRHAGSDFQESTRIFASSCVVLFVALIVLPMSLTCRRPKPTRFSQVCCSSERYVFVVVVVVVAQLCVRFFSPWPQVAVIGLMLGPKYYRLNAAEKSTPTTKGPGGMSSAASGVPNWHRSGNLSSVRLVVASSAKQSSMQASGTHESTDDPLVAIPKT